MRSEIPVELVSGSSVYQGIEGTSRVHRSRRCQVELDVPVLRARPGETLRGSLRVVPHQSVRARSVSLFLARRQSVEQVFRIVRSRRLAEDIEITGPSEFPFEVQVPAAACPTLITSRLWVRWYLQGSVRYSRLRADRHDSEINVYTKPP